MKVNGDARGPIFSLTFSFSLCGDLHMNYRAAVRSWPREIQVGTKHWEVLHPCIAHISSVLSGLAHVCPGLFWGSDPFSIICTFR